MKIEKTKPKKGVADLVSENLLPVSVSRSAVVLAFVQQYCYHLCRPIVMSIQNLLAMYQTLTMVFPGTCFVSLSRGFNFSVCPFSS